MRGASVVSRDGLPMEYVVGVIFVIGCAVAIVEWWRGPDIPRD